MFFSDNMAWCPWPFIEKAGQLMRALEGQRDETLEVGDVLLVQGRKEAIRRLKVSGILLLLDGALDAPMAAKRNMVIAIMLGVVVTAAVGIMPISVCGLTGAGADHRK